MTDIRAELAIERPLEEIGQLVGGMWLPRHERHLRHMMVDDPKARLERDGLLTYQLRKLDRALAHLPADRRGTAYDIGAHVGLWTIWLARAFARVACFEPVPDHIALWAENCRAHVADLGRLAMHACALGASRGTVELAWDPENTGNTHVGRDAGRQAITAEMYTLDERVSLCGDARPDFIKIDVEGFEADVILGAERTIRTARPLIVIEQKGNDAKFFGQPRDAALSILSGWGAVVKENISGDVILGWE